MKPFAAGTARALWGLWGAVQWSFALSQLVFIRGFFPPGFEALVSARLPAAAAAAALTAWSLGAGRGAAALAAAGASLLVAPADGYGPVLGAAAAWAPFLLVSDRPPARPPRDAGAEFIAAGAAALLAVASWGLLHRPTAAALCAFALMAAPISLAAAAAAGLSGRAAPLRIVLAAATAAWVLSRLLLAPLGLSGWTALLLALPAGWAAALAAGSLSGTGTLPGAARRAPTAAAALLCAIAGAAGAAGMESRPDWSHAVQGLTLFGAWTAAWLLCRTAAPPTSLSDGRAAGAATVLLAAAAAGTWAAGRLPAEAFVRAESQDAAARVLTRVLRGAGKHDEFFASLWSRMGRPDRPSQPWEAALPSPRVTPPFKPDIFILVVDSLRPDLLRAYGAAAALAPALDALAGESLVFAKAFTPFGGTTLAVSSLWAGALVPHGPLPAPFAPVNLLERLLEAEGYRKLMAPDVLTMALVKPPPAWEPFDVGHAVLRQACPALQDLGRRLGPKRRGEPPVFAFAHLYDLHVAQVERDDFRTAPIATGEGQRAAYRRAAASADACLGAFVAELKRLERWERTVLIVTADHGDSLGEEGRWGHAHTAFPEVLRVPLLAHIPPPLLKGLSPDLGSPALLTDITPTLAALLGRGPWPAGPGRGRPLLRREGEPAAEPGDLLVGSSYAPVFGFLSDAGTRLFLADAVDRNFSRFELPSQGPARRLPLSEPEISRGGDRLRELLRALDAYRVGGASKRATQAGANAERRTKTRAVPSR